MEPANRRTQAAQAEEALEAAIKHHEAIAEGLPGSWSVETGGDSVILVWSADDNDDAVANMYGDEPWSEWGGAAIIEDAGLREPDDSGGDSYHDHHGDNIVWQWVEWRME